MPTNKEILPGEMPEAAPSQASVKPSKKDRDPLFGTLLLSLLVLFVVASLAGAGYGAFRLWQKQESVSSAPSISGLGDMELPALPETDTSVQEGDVPEEPAEKTDASEGLAKAQATEIGVMNGGGAKGVAGQAAETLKAAGFAKVTVGNTIGNFAGTTLYHAAGLEKEAASVREKLIAKYPNITLKPADAANKETSAKPLVVIFGK